jgi:hypothetical protein
VLCTKDVGREKIIFFYLDIISNNKFPDSADDNNGDDVGNALEIV